jgi:hypothetical protein
MDPPLLEFNEIEDEDLKAGKGVPDAELNVDPPEDKPDRERDETGKFKGKEDDKKDEKKAEKKDEPKVEKKTDDTVPLAKYLDDRNKFKAELEQRDLTLRQMQAKLEEFEKKHAPKEEPEPDYIDDPQGYVESKLAKTMKALEEANSKTAESSKRAEEEARAARETAEINGFMQNLAAHEAQYVAKNPDYYDALAHVRQIRAFQLQQFQPGITDEQIAEAIKREELGLAVQLARAGRDPVATVHEMAKRYGYQPKAAAPPAAKPPVDSGTSRRLPPDQTLGGGQGAPDLDSGDDQVDEVDAALASLKRARA